jgi:nucleoside-diphosphate-sugar epimerase
MRVLVTGGSGFAGGAMIRRLKDEGHDVLALARSDASAGRVRALGAEPLIGDLEQLPQGNPAWQGVLASCDAIVHAAAYMEFWGPGRLYEQRNLHPTVALHAAAVRAGVSRFVLVSAASVSTGTQRAAVVDETTDNGRPNIAYSRVKLATERALLTAPSGKTQIIILRPPLIWGASMPTLEQMAGAVRAGQFAWIDHGRHTTDFIHVENLAHAITLSLDRGTTGSAYYVTDGAPRPVREFLTGLLGTQGVTLPSRSVPRPVATAVATVLETACKAARRPTAPPLTRWLVAFMGRDRSYNITAARRQFGYEPVVSFEEGLAAFRTQSPDGYAATA